MSTLATDSGLGTYSPAGQKQIVALTMGQHYLTTEVLPKKGCEIVVVAFVLLGCLVASETA